MNDASPRDRFVVPRVRRRTPIYRLCRRPIISVLAAALLAAAPTPPAHKAGHALTMDDVLNLTRIDHIALSPDGEWAAVVVQRAARPGEVYGRIYYEVDPSRDDVWLISRPTGERRNLTKGEQAAAGFWCATWSPDGRKLAMLSTAPQGLEPRGGDNVRLYVWDRATSAIARVSNAAMMTQTRYGSPLYRLDLRGGADGSTVAHRCSEEGEKAPFAWLDNKRLLAVMLAPGGISGLLDQYSRPMRHAERTARALRGGVEPTVTAVGSGAERLPRDEQANSAVLRTIDVETGAATTISTVPTYPFRGELLLSIAPGGHQLAVLATLGAIPPTRQSRAPYNDDSWTVEKRLGFVDLTPGAPVRWAATPPQTRYLLELFSWSPDGRRVALRSRGSADTTATPLFVASADDLSVVRVGPDALSVGDAEAGSDNSHETPVLWIDDRTLLARLGGATVRSWSTQARAPRADWWLLASDAAAVNLTAGAADPPLTFRRSSSGAFAVAAGALVKLDVGNRRLEPVGASLPAKSFIVWPRDAGRETSDILVATDAPTGEQPFEQIALGKQVGAPRGFTLPHGAQLLDVDPARGIAVSLEPTPKGLHLRETSLANDERRDLLALNTHLAAIDWGRTMLIDYRGKDGQALKAAVILPPGYQAGQRYPTITWVYAGYRVEDLDDYWLDPYLPGIYNLQLYAARGYVVLIPSIPLKRNAEKNELYPDIPKGVLPAVDRLIELGIADPTRVGVMGQSFGGYSVYALVTQSNRFKAAVAVAGLTDLAAEYTQFDPAARGYPGIEHEKSANWMFDEAGQVTLGMPPYDDYARFWRNSPLAYVDRVETPLLLIHGEYDQRGPMSQVESFFYSLYRQGKTARLLRYWGENHALALSPANVRDIFTETMRWFDKYLRGPAGRPSPDPTPAKPVGLM